MMDATTGARRAGIWTPTCVSGPGLANVQARR